MRSMPASKANPRGKTADERHLDCAGLCGLVVHLFEPNEHGGIEGLWGDAEDVELTP